MKLTKQRKIYLAILALALVALAVDRLLSPSGGTAPSEARASSDAPAAQRPAPEARKPEAKATAKDAPSASSVLADRLEEMRREKGLDLADAAAVPDAFTAPKSWPAVSGAGQATPRQSLAEKFAASHRLEAVMLGSESNYAVVNGRCLRVGETLDGFRLVAIGKQSATFDSEGLQVRLTLEKSDAGSGRG